MAVASSRLGAVQTLTPGNKQTLFTVPDNYTVVVREIRWVNLHTASVTVAFRVRTAGLTTEWGRATTGAGGGSAVSGSFLVLEEGDQLEVEVVNPTTGVSVPFSMYASGAVLSGVPPTI